MNNEIKLAHYTNCYMTTSMFMSYIKQLCKINTCMNKFLRTEKQIYLEESINIYHTVNNKINIHDDPSLVLYYIEDDYKEIVKNLMDWK